MGQSSHLAPFTRKRGYGSKPLSHAVLSKLANYRVIGVHDSIPLLRLTVASAHEADDPVDQWRFLIAGEALRLALSALCPTESLGEFDNVWPDLATVIKDLETHREIWDWYCRKAESKPLPSRK
jgi:hypothetical protein